MASSGSSSAAAAYQNSNKQTWHQSSVAWHGSAIGGGGKIMAWRYQRNEKRAKQRA